MVVILISMLIEIFQLRDELDLTNLKGMGIAWLLLENIDSNKFLAAILGKGMHGFQWRGRGLSHYDDNEFFFSNIGGGDTWIFEVEFYQRGG